MRIGRLDDAPRNRVDDKSRFVRGRFEAQFEDVNAAKAAARDARGVGFVVDVPRETAEGWLVVGRRRFAFPGDERDRYASRFHAIARDHGGAFTQFAEEPPEIGATAQPDIGAANSH